MLRWIDTFPCFSSVYTKGKKSSEFLLASQGHEFLPDWGLSMKERISPQVELTPKKMIELLPLKICPFTVINTVIIWWAFRRLLKQKKTTTTTKKMNVSASDKTAFESQRGKYFKMLKYWDTSKPLIFHLYQMEN